ncbi:MAG: hypothetical protein SFW66_07310 [Gammaproteobacteria bacterium]|nr:hypothetical protein [Gammaproteobacteria bacterium]
MRIQFVKLVLVFFLSTITFIYNVTAQAAEAAKKIAVTAVGEVVKMTGVVKAISFDKSERTLKEHSPIFPKDTLVTDKNSYAGLRFTDGTLAVMRPNTTIEMDGYNYTVSKESNAKLSPSDHFKIKLGTGGLDVNAGRIARGNPDAFQIATPAGKVKLNKPSANIAYETNKGLAFKGTGSIKNSAGMKDILNNAYALVTSSNVIPTLVTTAPAFLMTGQVTSVEYLQEEITTYGESTSYVETASYEEQTTEEAISEEDSSDTVATDSESTSSDASQHEAVDAGSQASDENTAADSSGSDDEGAAADNSGGDEGSAADEGGDSGGGDEGGGDSGDDGGGDSGGDE